MISELQEKEHEAWQKVFNEMMISFGKTREQLNDKKQYGKLFALIDEWGVINSQLDREVLEE